VYNHYDEDITNDVRFQHPFLRDHLGFMHAYFGADPEALDIITRGDMEKLAQRQGFQKNVPYSLLNNKWLFFYGDSTTRQLVGVLEAPLKGPKGPAWEKDLKYIVRRNCTRQDRKKPWPGICHLNEWLCRFPGYGPTGNLTYSWKHLAMEDYDEWLFSDKGIWAPDATRYPDMMYIQLGLHSCSHGAFDLKTNDPKPFDPAFSADDVTRVPLFFSTLNDAFQRRGLNVTTQVIIGTSGRHGTSSQHAPQVDRCVSETNRVIEREAHKYGFIVLDREEIERRLLSKTEFVPGATRMKSQTHLDPPGPQIVSTSLLTMMACIIDVQKTNNVTILPDIDLRASRRRLR
jgi:hypothetical protein